jgi:hypothetical protein
MPRFLVSRIVASGLLTRAINRVSRVPLRPRFAGELDRWQAASRCQCRYYPVIVHCVSSCTVVLWRFFACRVLILPRMSLPSSFTWRIRLRSAFPAISVFYEYSFRSSGSLHRNSGIPAALRWLPALRTPGHRPRARFRGYATRTVRVPYPSSGRPPRIIASHAPEAALSSCEKPCQSGASLPSVMIITTASAPTLVSHPFCPKYGSFVPRFSSRLCFQCLRLAVLLYWIDAWRSCAGWCRQGRAALGLCEIRHGFTPSLCLVDSIR